MQSQRRRDRARQGLGEIIGGAVGEVVLRTARHEHVHAARSRTFRLALEPSVRDKKKGRKTSNLEIHADSPIRWERLGVT